ncbi:MAG: hypothetical protein HN337_00985, partial [Deltaproteobacteria bacterium]|nr:hypothetical protein [Deltaproteobacteria bacterium]
MVQVKIIPCREPSSQKCEEVVSPEEYQEFRQHGGAAIEGLVSGAISADPVHFMDEVIDDEQTGFVGVDSAEMKVQRYARGRIDRAFGPSLGVHVELSSWDSEDVDRVASSLISRRGHLPFIVRCSVYRNLPFIVAVLEKVASDDKGSRVAASIINGIGDPNRRLDVLVELAKRNPVAAATTLMHLRELVRADLGDSVAAEMEGDLVDRWSAAGMGDSAKAAGDMLEYEAYIQQFARICGANTEPVQATIYALYTYFSSNRKPSDQLALRETLDKVQKEISDNHHFKLSYRLDFNATTGSIEQFQLYFSARDVRRDEVVADARGETAVQDEDEEGAAAPSKVVHEYDSVKAERRAMEDVYNRALSECLGKEVSYDYGASPEKQFAYLLEAECGIESEPAVPVLAETETGFEDGESVESDGDWDTP